VTDVLSLALHLRGLSDEELAALATAREAATDGPQDFFDLAEVLTGHQSIERALRHTSRPTLAVLGALATTVRPMSPENVTDIVHAHGGVHTDLEGVRQALDRASADGLVLSDARRARLLNAVRQQIVDWPARGLPDLGTLCATAAPTPMASEASAVEDAAEEDRKAGRAAFACLGMVAEILTELQRDPLPAHHDRPSSATLRRLAASLGTGAEDAAALFRLALNAGLTTVDMRRVHASRLMRDWLAQPARDRWHRLAAAWLDLMPARNRAILTETPTWGAGVFEFGRWLYPAAGRGLDKSLTATLDEARALGLLVDGRRSRAGAQLLSHGADTSTAIVAASFPKPVESVYVQDDLTIIAPGPLRGDLDVRLRDFCRVEGHRLASSYRVTEESVSRAVAAGFHAADLLDLLADISAGDIPQPLEYLVTEAAERYGRIRVGRRDREGTSPGHGGNANSGSVIRSVDETLLLTLEVDRALRPLGLRRHGAALFSDHDPEDVVRALAGEHYPAALEPAVSRDQAETATTLPSQEQAVTRGARAAALVARLRRAEREAGADLERTWIGRALSSAARTKSEVSLAVRMPGGGIRDYRLEVTGISARRVRGRDTASDVERTLPLSNIESVRP
jgi:hypothetical protein